jgi:thymidine phosphorylase
MTGTHYQNGIVQIKTEGERVAKGETIFRYYSNDEENLKKQIKEGVKNEQ